MKVKPDDANKNICVELSTFDHDDFWFMVSALSQDQSAMPRLTINLCLDKAIELRDKLTQIINTEVRKINQQLDVENPEKVAAEIAEVIDWQFKEA